MSAANVIRFTQFNANKCRNAFTLLVERLNKNDIHVGMVSEPRHVKNQIPKTNGYDLIYDNSGRCVPRAALLFKKGLKYLPLYQFVTADFVAAEIKADVEGDYLDVVIASGYHDGNKDSVPLYLTRLVDFCKREHKHLIYGVDANAHHEIWGSKKTKPRGRELLDYLISNDLVTVNHGSIPTFYTIRKVGQQIQKFEDVIDITVTSSQLYHKIVNWKVSEEISFSDHRFIDFCISMAVPERVSFRNPRNTDWNKFCEMLENRIRGVNLNIRDSEELDKSIDDFNRILMECYYETCPETSLSSNRNNRWWNNDLTEMKKRLRREYRNAEREDKRSRHERGSNERSDIFKKFHELQAEYKEAIKRAKSQSWKRTLDELNDASATSKMYKLLSKEHTNPIGSLLKDNGVYTGTEKETLSFLAGIHFPGSTELSSDDTFTQEVNDFQDVDYSNSRRLFTNEAVIWAISSFKPYKSAGPDGIIPVLLQKGLEHILPAVRMFLIKSHAWNYIPVAWRRVNVIYIPKVGRKSGLAKSLRPISLSCCLVKVLERVLDREIRDSILIQYPLHSHQFAYQAGKSTVAALQALKNQITKSFKVGEYALGAFLDIAGAFDNTSFEAIAEALVMKGVSRDTAGWIVKMLEGREVTTTLGSTEFSFKVTRGCPQGGVLSPLLWCLVVDDLIVRLNRLGFYTQGYADDIVILSKGKFSNAVSDRMQAALDFVTLWCGERGLSVNPLKTELVLFTRNRKLRGPLRRIKMLGQEINYSSEVKYLGVIFDCKLNWNAHLERVISKATASLFTCKRMVGNMWGLKPKMMLWIYTAIVRPILSYAAIVWWEKTTRQNVQRKLNKFQRLACLMVLGCSNLTPTAAMEVLIDIPPLHLFIKRDAMNMNFKFRCSEFSELRDITDENLDRIESSYESLRITFSDACLRRYNFVKRFDVEISERSDWEEDLSTRHEMEAEVWYTDGSKTVNGTGCGIYDLRSGFSQAECMGKNATVFQAEVEGINLCTKHLLDSGTRGRSVFIYSDSRAALQALSSTEFTSKLVYETVDNINMLGYSNSVKLCWIPAHEGFVGNEVADLMAQEGANRVFSGPEPFTGMPWCMMKASMHKWLYDERRRYFLSCKELKHSKLFIRDLDKARGQVIINLTRSETRLVTAAFTGRYALNDYLFKVGLREDDRCRFCDLVRENMQHVLCECSALDRTRNQVLGSFRVAPSDFNGLGLGRIAKFLKDVGI